MLFRSDLPVNSLNPSFCCNDTSFADYTDNADTIKGKCCHTTVISQSDAFLKQEADPVFYNSEFFISYLIPMICLYDVFKPVSRKIQTYADMQHSLSELCGRKLLSLICILRISILTISISVICFRLILSFVKLFCP